MSENASKYETCEKAKEDVSGDRVVPARNSPAERLPGDETVDATKKVPAGTGMLSQAEPPRATPEKYKTRELRKMALLAALESIVEPEEFEGYRLFEKPEMTKLFLAGNSTSYSWESLISRATREQKEKCKQRYSNRNKRKRRKERDQLNEKVPKYARRDGDDGDKDGGGGEKVHTV